MLNRTRQPEANPLNVKSVFKALDIIEAFENQPRWLTLGEIVAATGLDKSAVQRFTHTLVQRGYLEQDPVTRRFGLGRQLLAVTFDYLRGQELIQRASPILIELRDVVQERVDLSIRHGEVLLYLMRLQQKRETYASGLIGRRLPLYLSAGGRAMLSMLSEEEAEEIVARSDRAKRTPKTKTDISVIMEEVKKARSQGYALQVEEGKLDEIAVAAAILDLNGTPMAAVHVAASMTEWTPARFEARVAPLVAAAAQEISR